MNKPLSFVLGIMVVGAIAVGAVFALSGDDEKPVHSTATTGNSGSVPAGAGSVAGSVSGPTGQPVAGVLVVPVSLEEPAVAVPERAVVTDQDGRFRWELPAGRYELRLAGAGISGSTTVTVRPGAEAPAEIVAR